jgi:hypothetical protein
MVWRRDRLVVDGEDAEEEVATWTRACPCLHLHQQLEDVLRPARPLQA